MKMRAFWGLFGCAKLDRIIIFVVLPMNGLDPIAPRMAARGYRDRRSVGEFSKKRENRVHPAGNY